MSDEQNTDWMAGLSDEQKTIVENNGWGSVADVIDNFKALQSHVGVPQDQILRMPQKPEDWVEFYNKLGRPEKPEGYEYETPEGGDAELTAWAKSTFHELGLSQEQAKKFFEAYDGLAAERMEKQAGSLEDKLVEQQATLKRLWGNAYEQNMGAAKTGARALGLEDSVIDALQQQIGFDGVMVAMENIGRKVGEAAYHSGQSTFDADRQLAPDAANRRIAELRGNQEFMDKWHGGDPSAQAKMDALYQMASPEAVEQ